MQTIEKALAAIQKFARETLLTNSRDIDAWKEDMAFVEKFASEQVAALRGYQTTEGEAQSLSAQIMRIQVAPTAQSMALCVGDTTLAYKLGHRDVRHAAAELADAYAPPPPMGGEPVAIKRHDPECHMVGSNDGGRVWIEELTEIPVGTKLYTSPMGGEAEGWVDPAIR